MKKAILLLLSCAAWGTVQAQSPSATRPSPSAGGRLHLDVGVDVGGSKMLGPVVENMRAETAEYNAIPWQGPGPNKVYFYNPPRPSPSLRVRAWHALGTGGLHAGAGLQYQWLRMREQLEFLYPEGGFVDPSLRSWKWQTDLSIHRLGMPLAFGWFSPAGRHRVFVQATPQLLLGGRGHEVQLERKADGDVNAYMETVVPVKTVPVDGPAWDGYTYGGENYRGFSRVCVEVGMRYEWAFPLARRAAFVGAALGYSLNPFQYQYDVSHSAAGAWPNGNNTSMTVRTLSGQVGVGVQVF